MKSTAIQETLVKLLEIDDSSTRLEEDMDALKGLKEKELKKKEREMELAFMKEARKRGKTAYDRVMEAASQEEAEIVDEGEINDRRMRRLFEKHHHQLVETAMKRIFGVSSAKEKE